MVSLESLRIDDYFYDDDVCSAETPWYACAKGVTQDWIETFRSDYYYEYENEISNVHLLRMHDSESMSHKVVLSSKISSPSCWELRDFQENSFPKYDWVQAG